VVSAALYIVLGWLGHRGPPQLAREMTVAELVPPAGRGPALHGGAIMFASRRPDPSPSIFGYHEVWHSFMVAAAACHYAMILLLLLPR
jgi:hemolysin III